jgi:predicted AAA+ superfamily ATPase
MSKDQTNPDIIIVSIVGPKKIGKSFLVDCLISH